jgi:hypothetical protein
MYKFVLSVVIIYLTTVSASLAQKTIVDNGEFKLSIELKQSNDSIRLILTLLNKTEQSFYFSKDHPISYWWSTTGNLLDIKVGTDLKAFTESAFEVVQVDKNNTYDKEIKLPLVKDKFTMSLGISVYGSTARKKQIIGNLDIQDKKVIWGEYHFPICLDPNP